MDAHLHGLVRNIGVVMLLSESNEEEFIFIKNEFQISENEQTIAIAWIDPYRRSHKSHRKG